MIGANLLITLPEIACLMNLSRPAAIYGCIPKNLHWPFASQRVITFYVLLTFVVHWK
jgi:hypothetical protein